MSTDRATRSKAKPGNLLIVENNANKQPKKRGRKPKNHHIDNENEDLHLVTPFSPEKSIPSTLASTSIQTEISLANNKALNYTNMSKDDQHKLAIDILEKLNLQRYVANFKHHEVTIEFLVSKK